MFDRKLKPIAAAIGGVVVAGLAGASGAVADTDAELFTTVDLSGGYELAAHHEEGKCGEGKCGGDSKDDAKDGAKDGEGSCGEGKCGEGKCGGDSKDDAKDGEGKCGEGKCGG